MILLLYFILFKPELQSKIKPRDKMSNPVIFTVKGTTLIPGGNSHTWMKRKRKKLNGEMMYIPFVRSTGTHFQVR